QRFSFSSTLIRHMGIHSSDLKTRKIHKCGTCGNKFTSIDDEESKKLYECDQCERKVIFKRNLTRHRLTYSGKLTNDTPRYIVALIKKFSNF
ncbi:hypothetical protein PMAYCL1PPCAC_08684, partial [Pristionchus mayeri]